MLGGVIYLCIVALFITKATASFGESCPVKCVCQQRIAVHCAGMGLVKMPKRLPTGTMQLLVENNRIKQLPPQMLQNGDSLHTLTLHGNQIARLESRNFRSTPALNYLDLSSNNITYIPANTFLGLEDLQMLSLTGNQISRLSPLAFADLPSLRDLFLSENNIRALPIELFTKLSNLQTLQLAGNSISTVPDGIFRTLTSLVSLDLSRNRIRHISMGTTNGLHSLQELFFKSNQLEGIDEHLHTPELTCDELVGKSAKSEILHLSKEEGVLSNLRQLRVLDLRYNSLQTLKFSSLVQLSKLRDLKLDENRWRCDCSLKWTIKTLRLKLRNQHMAWGEIHCAEPKNIKNINLEDITLHDLKSLVPTVETTTSKVTPDDSQWSAPREIKQYSNNENSFGQPRGPFEGQSYKKLPVLEPKEDTTESRPRFSANGGNRASTEGPLRDPPDEKGDNLPEREIITTTPPLWSLDRIAYGDAIPTITSYSPRRHDNGDDDVRSKAQGGFPIVRKSTVKFAKGFETMVTTQVDEESHEGNTTILRDDRNRNLDDIHPQEIDVDFGGGIARTGKENTRTKKEKGTEKWMLASVVILSFFAVIACASLTAQKHYRGQDKSWKCCFKKDNIHTASSFRSVTTYPLLYDNALARRPLPREPSFALSSRAPPREDVRWTNGGVYGLGSNRSSFISLQTSQTNVSNISGITTRTPASQIDLSGSQALLLPRTPGRVEPGHPRAWHRNSDLHSYGEGVPSPSSDAWRNHRQSLAVPPSYGRQNLQRSQSAAVTDRSRENRSDTRRAESHREETQRNNQEDRRRRRRKRRSSRRPESAIIVPTLHEYEGEFGMSPDMSKQMDFISASRAASERKTLRRHKSECRPDQTKAKNLCGITEAKEPHNQESAPTSKTDRQSHEEMNPVQDALEHLDGVITQHLPENLSPEVSECDDDEQKETSESKNQTYNSSLYVDIEEQRDADHSSDNVEEKPTKHLDMSSNCEIPTGETQGKVRASGYDKLALCTSGVESTSTSHSWDENDEDQSCESSPEAATVSNKADDRQDNNNDLFGKRRESTDSMFVDLESICESVITEDGSSCFGDGVGDFEIIYHPIDSCRTYPGDVYGSDQYILDSLRDQDKMLGRPMNHTSPGGMEHLTVPLSELSSEEEDTYSVLQLQSIRSRSSSVGSISTVINKKVEAKDAKADDFVYTMAAEFPAENIPKIVINKSDEKPISESYTDSPPQNKRAVDGFEKIEVDEQHYHHIQDMYSGFTKMSKETRSRSVVQKQPRPIFREMTPNTQDEKKMMQNARKRRRPYSYIQYDINNRSSNQEKPPSKENIESKKKKKTRQEEKQNSNEGNPYKDAGYFESIESSEDGNSTDVELFDLGTL